MASEDSGAAYLKIGNLTKKFGDFTALDDISLDVYENEFVCFLGPSGCGKTTLLRAIAGLDIQTAGSIKQAGKEISTLPPGERDFGIVFQSYALFPNLTVHKNVAYGLENRKLPADQIKARVAELLVLVGLHDQGNKYPAQLSGGQRQRVSLMRALMPDPDVLLLDEPLGALDPVIRYGLQDELRDIFRALGKTVVMVTHDIGEAGFFGDDIVLIRDGVIIQRGDIRALAEAPADDFIRQFVHAQRGVADALAEPRS